jgi:DNA topoisomerase-1
VTPPELAARAVRLRYVSDTEPGLRRVRRGHGVGYVDPDGKAVRDPDTLARIAKLAIPPAYEEVWICRSADGHLQATGRDARGRKQYRYHPDWHAVRDADKFMRMEEFGRALPRIRRRVALDLKRPGMPREKVLATVVRLLESTLIRVGNEEYARENKSYGLTTLRTRHVDVSGERIEFEFRGKGGLMHHVVVTDPRLAAVVRRLRDLPGQELFQYLDETGERRSVGSADVNDYLREISGGDFTAKDFRTWYATLAALVALEKREFTSETQAAREVKAAITEVAQMLRNTPAICRKSYVHPLVVECFLNRALTGPGTHIGAAKRLLTLLARASRAATRAARAKRGGTGVALPGLSAAVR